MASGKLSTDINVIIQRNVSLKSFRIGQLNVRILIQRLNEFHFIFQPSTVDHNTRLTNL